MLGEHYSQLYSRMNVVSEEALMAMESLSTMDGLDSVQHWKKSTNTPPVRVPREYWHIC